MQEKDKEDSHVADVKVNLEKIEVEPLTNGITIAQLFEKKEEYANKIVRIRGKVTKYTEKILYRNWIHLQDGSNFHGNFDLTVTTEDTSKMGDIVIIEGKVVLNKDFGYGYSYKVLLEDAKIIKK